MKPGVVPATRQPGAKVPGLPVSRVAARVGGVRTHAYARRATARQSMRAAQPGANPRGGRSMNALRRLRRTAGALVAAALLLSLSGCFVVPVAPMPGYGYHAPWGWHHDDD